MTTKKTKKRRSSKKRPMTMEETRRHLSRLGIESWKMVPVEEVRLGIPITKRGVESSLHVMMSESGDDLVFLRCHVGISVPKERVGEAARLLQRLHKLK